jgi:pimeloyl-ACP methyl ester carboxylesterase
VAASLTRRRLLEGAAALAATGAVAGPMPAPRRAAGHPAHFVLVHGAWHGAWCWYRIVSALEARGHVVTAVDLPSAGIDVTPAAPVTLQAQADRIIALLDGVTEPVVLVGHSAGGPVISTVAEARPGKIARLVYLTAYLLADGESILSVVSRDPESLVPASLAPAAAGTIFLRPEAVRDLFYGVSDDADVALARSLLKPIGLLPTATPVAVGSAFASVRRFYVTCRRDRAITFAFQRAMIDALPCERTFTIDSDHSAFFSRPRALVRILDAIAAA